MVVVNVVVDVVEGDKVLVLTERLRLNVGSAEWISAGQFLARKELRRWHGEKAVVGEGDKLSSFLLSTSIFTF